MQQQLQQQCIDGGDSEDDDDGVTDTRHYRLKGARALKVTDWMLLLLLV